MYMRGSAIGVCGILRRVEPAAVTIAPDWSIHYGEYLCPLCEYNLRGLADARCPECGHRFDWRDITNRDLHHPYLFEHHPAHNFKSFFRALLGSFSPLIFWRK